MVRITPTSEPSVSASTQAHRAVAKVQPVPRMSVCR